MEGMKRWGDKAKKSNEGKEHGSMFTFCDFCAFLRLKISFFFCHDKAQKTQKRTLLTRGRREEISNHCKRLKDIFSRGGAEAQRRNKQTIFPSCRKYRKEKSRAYVQVLSECPAYKALCVYVLFIVILPVKVQTTRVQL